MQDRSGRWLGWLTGVVIGSPSAAWRFWAGFPFWPSRSAPLYTKRHSAWTGRVRGPVFRLPNSSFQSSGRSPAFLAERPSRMHRPTAWYYLVPHRVDDHGRRSPQLRTSSKQIPTYQVQASPSLLEISPNHEKPRIASAVQARQRLRRPPLRSARDVLPRSVQFSVATNVRFSVAIDTRRTPPTRQGSHHARADAPVALARLHHRAADPRMAPD